MNLETLTERRRQRYNVIPEENQYIYKTRYAGDHVGLEAAVRSRKPKGTSTHDKMIEEFISYQNLAESTSLPTEKLEMQVSVNEEGGVMFAISVPINNEIGVS